MTDWIVISDSRNRRQTSQKEATDKENVLQSTNYSSWFNGLAINLIILNAEKTIIAWISTFYLPIWTAWIKNNFGFKTKVKWSHWENNNPPHLYVVVSFTQNYHYWYKNWPIQNLHDWETKYFSLFYYIFGSKKWHAFQLLKNVSSRGAKNDFRNDINW